MLKKTALHDLHISLGAKMGEFAGYDMPLYYDLGVMKEHEWVRNSCGLFDVSHMGQVMIKGADGAMGALEFMEHITPSVFGKLGIDRTKYTVLTNEQGGIIDDLMVTKTGEDSFHLVINAGCKDKDIEWIKSHMPETLEFTYFDDWALLALQGQKAEQVMKEAMQIDLSDLPYMGMTPAKAPCGTDIYISRLGYTGEDGFEIAVPNERAADAAKLLLEHEAVQPIGLAARDSLRLEMGYCLYGHDIDAETNPMEADLTWVMSRNNQDFIGGDAIKENCRDGLKKKRVGIRLTDKGVAREGAEIRNEADEVIGTLTSGGFSPTLQESIGMGYVPMEMAEPGTKLFVNVRGRNIAAEIAPLPFVAPKTKSMKKKAAA